MGDPLHGQHGLSCFEASGKSPGLSLVETPKKCRKSRHARSVAPANLSDKRNFKPLSIIEKRNARPAIAGGWNGEC